MVYKNGTIIPHALPFHLCPNIPAGGSPGRVGTYRSLGGRDGSIPGAAGARSCTSETWLSRLAAAASLEGWKADRAVAGALLRRRDDGGLLEAVDLPGT